MLPFNRLTPVMARVAFAFLACSLVAACHSNAARTPSPSPKSASVTPSSVVRGVQSSDVSSFQSCPGISESNLKAMFGEKVTLSTFSSWSDATCSGQLDGVTVFNSRFGFVREGVGPWNVPFVARAPTSSEFSFENVDGVGEAQIYSGEPRTYGTTAFICGDHYLVMTVRDAKYMKGDLRSNLISMTEVSLPWLCQGQPVPGLGKTMEEIRSPSTTRSPSSETPAG